MILKRSLALLVSILCVAAAQAAPDLLCSTFPVYQITRNVVAGREDVTVGLLLPASLGCPHNYSLTPRDMRKLSRADVLIINGLGMEEFLGAPLKRANPGLKVVDTGASVTNLIQTSPAVDTCASCGGGHDAHHHHAAKQASFNPHLFTSPLLRAQIARVVAESLAEIDPGGAALYASNATAYAGRMHALADEMKTSVAQLNNNRIVQPHGAFDYLARDIGLEVVAITQPHGQEPSAAELLRLTRTIRAKKAGVIVSEPQYSDRVGKTLSRETGVPTAQLDPTASGVLTAPLDHYEKTMRKNMGSLRAAIGVKE